MEDVIRLEDIETVFEIDVTIDREISAKYNFTNGLKLEETYKDKIVSVTINHLKTGEVWNHDKAFTQSLAESGLTNDEIVKQCLLCAIDNSPYSIEGYEQWESTKEIKKAINDSCSAIVDRGNLSDVEKYGLAFGSKINAQIVFDALNFYQSTLKTLNDTSIKSDRLGCERILEMTKDMSYVPF